MNTVSKKHIFFTGLMLFSLFFGAGNLIFPPMLGQNAGENFWPAMIGFLLTGVGLPLLTVIAISLSGNGMQQLASHVHPLF
ncbi:branched-chain amino acid transport protein, N-terminal domain protein [Bacillus cereus biovar anthracis str. CI]|nr:branched-chain amino acid transport protein, N-terminal domain protein [Bacillus cereus biovar anthracis str. CI]